MHDIKTRLDNLVSQLVPVAGTLMMVATSNGRCAREPDIHEEDCNCKICRAFLATQDVQNKLEEIIRELSK